MSAAKALPKGIYHRGPHQFQVKVRMNGVAQSKTFETLEAAVKWRTIQKGKIVGDEFVDTRKERRTTLSRIIQRYLDEITPSKKGARQEANRLNGWLATDLADYSIAAVEPSDIASWIKARTTEGKAPSTISNEVNVLSAVFKKAREWGYKVDNPCQGVSRPPPRQARFARLSEAQQALLIQSCEAGPVWLPFVVRIALTTAMRQGEIRRLRWDDIHSDWLHVPETKNGESRDVPLTHAAEAVIADMRARIPHRIDGWVFGDPDKPSKEGGFTNDQVQQAYADAAKRAEAKHAIPHLTFHDLRHVAITSMKDWHSDVLELQRMTGHKTLGVLSRYLNKTASETAATMREREMRDQRKAARKANRQGADST